MSAVESTDLTISKVFSDFYAVPDYQREYVWEEDQVQQLLEDIRTEQKESGGAEYFIGSIVTVLNADKRFELIDGQQRMTTIFIAVCALRDRLIALGDHKVAAIENLISTLRVDDDGNESQDARLLLQYEDAGDAIAHLVEGRPLKLRSVTRSVSNMARAHRTATEFYSAEFQSDTVQLRAFFGYLINRVKLIRVQTDGLARALKIFETINDRGVGLDSMDLLKNLLFRSCKRELFDRLKTRWKELVDGLFKAGEKPLRFLRYFVLATYGVEKLREDELYQWLVANEALVGYKKDPVAFVEKLNSAARAYVNFLAGNGIDGRPHADLEAIRLLAGKSTRQHLILLLAGRELQEDVFAALCRDAERLLFVYLITRQTNREFEVMFPVWGRRLASVRSLEDYRGLSDDTFARRRSELAERFKREFAALDGRSVRVFQLRYILAKLTQAVDVLGFGPSAEGARWLSRYCDAQNVHIEHITPQTPSAEVEAEFGERAGDPSIIWSIGNLALAEAAINQSLGNKPFSARNARYAQLEPLKATVYPQSQYLLTRAISQQIQIGKNTAIDRAVSLFAPFSSWSAAGVEQRAAQLAELAMSVWDIRVGAAA